MLVITVFGEQDLSGKFAVGPSGNIALPVAGAIKVAGLTLEETRETVTKLYRELVRRPRVTVAVDELASERKVYVSGYVAHPGPLALPFGATLTDAIAAAAPQEMADLRRVQLTHSGSPRAIIDMSGFRAGSALNVSELLRYGDIVYVPKLEDEITVLGQVERPGSALMPVDHDIRIIDAIGRIAGGLTATADRSKATLLRQGGQPIAIDLKKLLLEGDASQNLTMKAGDTLVIQEAGKISVLGEVGAPRSFDAPEPLNVIEALANAGGTKATSGLEKSRIIRADGTEQQVDLRALVRDGKVANNLILRAGDALVVPEAEPETVLCVGALRAPGTFNVREVKEHDALRIITQAGLQPNADLSRVSVLRKDKRIAVNMHRILRDGDLSTNCDLEAGDVVLVPELDRMYVLGAVGRQGELAVEPDMKLIDALARSGGIAPNSNANASVLIRMKSDGTSEFIKVPLADLQRGIAPEPTNLRPGDILYVPPSSGRRFGWDTVRDVLWYIGAVVGIRNAF